MNIVEMLYKKEDEYLSPYACKSRDTKGRAVYVEPDGLRTDFQRDRDRITHSKAFRRLMHKTQVFLSPEDEHFRTRLTHTLEVTQIARTIARGLSLNEDLTEAAALGHDLGHTPFGHAGERILQQCFSPDFTHYKQSLRVVDKLENGGAGLNLTYEVRGYYKLADDAPGVVVSKVQPGNPAAVAGLRPLEIVTHVDDKPVKDVKALSDAVRGKKEFSLSVRRLAATRIVRVKMQDGGKGE